MCNFIKIVQRRWNFCICLAIWLFVIAAGLSGFYVAYTVFYDVAIDEDDLSKVEVTISGNESDEEIGKMLLSLKMIDDVDMFRLRAKIYSADYVGGNYSLSRSYTTEKLINILCDVSYDDGTLME